MCRLPAAPVGCKIMSDPLTRTGFRKTPARLLRSAVLAVWLLAGLAACDPDQPRRADSPRPANEPASAESAEVPPSTDTAQRASEQAAPWTRLQPDEVVYETYRNDAFGYSIDYPANIFETQRAMGNDGGRFFATKDGRAEMSVYAVALSEPKTARQQYQAHLNNPKQEITYQTVHDDWFVVSGYIEDEVFYERTIVREGVLKTFRIQYDAALRDFFYPITEAISFSFEG